MAEKSFPGRISVDHVGFSVPDLEQAVDLFVNGFGCEIAYMGGPYDDAGYVWPGEEKPAETPLTIAMLVHGGTQVIELLHYDNPANESRIAPRPNEMGGAHICFYCEEIEGVVEALRKRDDITVMGDVEREVGGAIDGTDWVYTVTSWGLVIELMRWIPGMLPYEKDTEVRLVSPPWMRK